MVPLSAYIEAAMEMARYDKLEDSSFAGEIRRLPGVVAFGTTLRQCEHELRSTLEDWIWSDFGCAIGCPAWQALI